MAWFIAAGVSILSMGTVLILIAYANAEREDLTMALTRVIFIGAGLTGIGIIGVLFGG